MSDNMQILFIDDDMILQLPSVTADIISGLHCRSESAYKMNRSEVLDTDFSGYISKFVYLHQYFAHRNPYDPSQDTYGFGKYLAHLEDTKFMNYLDSNGSVNNPDPFIFYRLWGADDREMSTWRKDLFNKKTKKKK